MQGCADVAGFDELMANRVIVGDDPVLQFDDGDSLTLLGVNPDDLTERHFLFCP